MLYIWNTKCGIVKYQMNNAIFLNVPVSHKKNSMVDDLHQYTKRSSPHFLFTRHSVVIWSVLWTRAGSDRRVEQVSQPQSVFSVIQHHPSLSQQKIKTTTSSHVNNRQMCTRIKMNLLQINMLSYFVYLIHFNHAIHLTK